MSATLRIWILAVVTLQSVGWVSAQSRDAVELAARWNAEATANARRGENEAAIAAFTKSLEVVPRQPDALVGRAVVRARMEQWQAAEADCTAAIEMNDEDAAAFQHRAVVRSAQGKHQEAFRDASRAARMNPEDPNVVFARYLTCSRLGRYDVAHYIGEQYIGLKTWSDSWSPYIALLNHVSLRRAGFEKESRSILAEAARWLDGGEWPVPVIEYLQDEREAESLLQMAADDDQRVIARYYIGVNEWLSGNETAAREHFEWIRENGNRSFLQYLLAGDHLIEMEAGVAPGGGGGKTADE